MIKRAEVLRNPIEKSIFQALTVACCMEEDLNGKTTYYLHGNEETGDLYDLSGEHNPENVLFTCTYDGETEEDFEHERMNNPRFKSMIDEFVVMWKDKYDKF